jgi:choline dehydrogenase-like flavoprotein
MTSSSLRLKMYYEPHASRSNLIVLTSAHVTRISLSQVASGEVTAESISFLHEGKEYRTLVKKEVILSAGYASRSNRGMDG